LILAEAVILVMVAAVGVGAGLTAPDNVRVQENSSHY